MRYRRNADTSLRDLERKLAQDPSLGLQYYLARRRFGNPIGRSDYEALADFTLSGGEIPYEIEQELSFPYDIARTVWDALPVLQSWYRLRKVQGAEWRSWLSDNHPGVRSRYSIEDEEESDIAELHYDSIVVPTNNERLASLWVDDIVSRLTNIREEFRFDYISKKEKILINGVHLTNRDDIFSIKYYSDKMTESGSLFTLMYKPECCYDSDWSPNGTVMASASGAVSGGAYANSYEVSYFVEYGRFYAGVVPPEMQKSPPVGEDSPSDRINVQDYISPMHPISRTNKTRETLIEEGVPVNDSLVLFVNGEHLMDKMREHYQWLVPVDAGRSPGYKNYFENYVHKYRTFDGDHRTSTNQNLMNSIYYKEDYPHIWQLNRVIGADAQNDELLDILKIPNDNGRILPGSDGSYYFQNYEFNLADDDLSVVCPITGYIIPVSEWASHSASLLI
jgi:hypothetical protein